MFIWAFRQVIIPSALNPYYILTSLLQLLRGDQQELSVGSTHLAWILESSQISYGNLCQPLQGHYVLR